MNQYFKTFKSECEIWINKLGLQEWRIEIYIDEDSNNDRAYVVRNASGMVSTIFLCTKWIEESKDSKQEITRQVKECAKHECIHLLLGQFAYLAYERYVSESQLEMGEEALVRKLEKLI